MLFRRHDDASPRRAKARDGISDTKYYLISALAICGCAAVRTACLHTARVGPPTPAMIPSPAGS